MNIKSKNVDKIIDVVIDTDTYNEVDDQFAVTYALLSKERINVKAVYAAPFLNKKSSSAKDGMEKSYKEIVKLFSLLSRDSSNLVFRGSEGFLVSEDIYRESPAGRHLVDLVMNSDKKIYVIAIAALTNIASAILMNPKIAEKMVVVWLGGHDYHSIKKNEFNLRQDIAAARVVFDSGVELIQIPCNGVASHLITTIAELEKFIDGKNLVGTYLTDIVRECKDDVYAYSRVIWDISAVGWVVNNEWVPTIEQKCPIITNDLEYLVNENRHIIKKAIAVDRDSIFSDMFKKIGLMNLKGE